MPRKKTGAPPGRRRINPPEMSRRFMIRATPEDVEAWRSFAESCGLSLAAWIRMTVNVAAGRGHMGQW